MKLTRLEKFRIRHMGLMTQGKIDSIINNFNELSDEDKKYIYNMVDANYIKQLTELQDVKLKIEQSGAAKGKNRSIDDSVWVGAEDFIAFSFLVMMALLPVAGITYLVSGSTHLVGQLVTGVLTFELVPAGAGIIYAIDDDYSEVKLHPCALHLKGKYEKTSALKTSLDKIKNASTTTEEEQSK